MASDQLANFIKVTVSTGYAAGVTSIVLASGEGAEVPDPASGEFNLVWWDATEYIDPADDPNVEIVRVTAKTGDTLTITRAQEGTSDSDKNTGGSTYKMILSPTEKTMSDIDPDERINQVSHGFSIGNVLYHNGSIYALADASAAATAEVVGIVSSVSTDGDYFTLKTIGKITGLSGLTVGEAHFLSETPGALTATEPTTTGAVVKPVLVADSTVSGYIVIMRGNEVTASASRIIEFTSADGASVDLDHNFGNKYVQVQVFDQNDKMIIPDEVELVSSTQATLDITSYNPITGTWRAVVLDTGASVTVDAVPSGIISIWSGAISAIPSGWGICDGTLYNGTTQSPDLTDRFVLHADSDSGGTNDVGDTGGASTHQLTIAEMPSHIHSIVAQTNDGVGGSNTAVETSSQPGNTSRNTNSTGGDGFHNNRDKYYALAYIIKI